MMSMLSILIISINSFLQASLVMAFLKVNLRSFVIWRLGFFLIPTQSNPVAVDHQQFKDSLSYELRPCLDPFPQKEKK